MIKKLEISNIKKISFMELTPDDNLIKLRGKNAQGKTSVIDSIMMALGGSRAIGEYPIKEGESSGQIILETDFCKVQRDIYKSKYGETKTSLTIFDKQGNLIKRPQEFLNRLLGDSIVSPEEIIHKAPKDRIEMLKTAFGIDFSDLDGERGRLFNERTERRRTEKLMTGNLLAYRHLPEKQEGHRTAEEILKDIKEAEIPFERERESKALQSRERAEIQELYEERDGAMSNVQQQSFAANELNIKIKEMIERKNQLEREVKKNEKWLDDVEKRLVEAKKKISKGYTVLPKDIERMDVLKEELKRSSLVEKESQEMKLRDKIYKDRENERKIISLLGREIDNIDNEKKRILRDTKFPIDGMEFGELDIMFNGIPFLECSMAEKIKIAVAICVKTNSDAKIMRLEDGSLLDSDSLKEIEEMAKESGTQIWVEIVEQGKDNSALIIEEGHIVK